MLIMRCFAFPYVFCSTHRVQMYISSRGLHNTHMEMVLAFFFFKAGSPWNQSFELTAPSSQELELKALVF